VNFELPKFLSPLVKPVVLRDLVCLLFKIPQNMFDLGAYCDNTKEHCQWMGFKHILCGVGNFWFCCKRVTCLVWEM